MQYVEAQNPLDFKEGDEYLLYLTKQSQECRSYVIEDEDHYVIMRGGLYNVLK